MVDVKLTPLSWPPAFIANQPYLILHAGTYHAGKASILGTSDHRSPVWQVHVGSHFIQFNQLGHARWRGTQVWEIGEWTVVDHLNDILEAL